MEESVSAKEFREKIRYLPKDEPKTCEGVWYRSQNQHWMGWLRDYDGPGAYHRKGGENRDAKFAYNHIVCPQMLLYLIAAIPLSTEIIEKASQAIIGKTTEMAQSGAIRKVAPWSMIYQALWMDQSKETILKTVKRKWIDVLRGY